MKDIPVPLPRESVQQAPESEVKPQGSLVPEESPQVEQAAREAARPQDSPSPEETTHADVKGGNSDVRTAKDFNQVQTKSQDCAVGKWENFRKKLQTHGFHSIIRLMDLLGLPGSPPERWVAIFKDRFVALSACALHLPPLVATAVIGYYIYHEHWIGAQITVDGMWDSQARLGLQFAAKFLEGVIIASLATMIFTFARYEAILGQGAPLASFSACTDFSSLSFLWSGGLWAMLTGRFSSAGRKLFFLLFVIVCCLLAVTVAPATATVLLPVQGWYVLSGTRMYLNSTDVEPFPRVITAADNTPGEDACRSWGRAYCPSDGWEFVRELVSPLASRVATKHLSQTVSRHVATLKGYNYNMAAGLEVCVSRDSLMSPNKRNVTIISIPHHAMAAALMYSGTIWGQALDLAQENGKWYRGSTHRITTMAEQVAVETICTVQQDRDGYQNSSTLTFPDVRGTGHDARDVVFAIKNPGFLDMLAQLNGSRAQVHFFDMPEDLQAVASVGAVVALPRPEGSPTVLGCLLNAQWHGATPLSYNIDNREIRPLQEPNDHVWSDAKGIKVLTSFANLTNLPIEDAVHGSSSIFEELVKVSASGTLLETVADEPRSASIPCAVEAILNAMLGNGLARTTPQIGPFLDIKEGDWWKSFFPPPYQTFSVEWGQTIFDVPDALVRSGHWADMRGEMFGYAYTIRDETVQYSMLGLFVYSFIAVCYILWSVAFGVTSSTWQSTPEIVALAMRSPPPEHGKTTAGIFFGTEELRKRYVLVAENDKIQLQWLEDKKERVPAGSRVKPNQLYK